MTRGYAAGGPMQGPAHTTAVPVFDKGQRVKFVGIHGRADGLAGRVIGQCASGVLVRWDSGDRYSVHPEDITAVIP